MKEYKVNLTSQFLAELERTLYFFPYSYITRKKLYTEVKNTVLSLEIFPERYSQVKNYKMKFI